MIRRLAFHGALRSARVFALCCSLLSHSMLPGESAPPLYSGRAWSIS